MTITEIEGIIDIKDLKKHRDIQSCDEILEYAKGRFDKLLIVGYTHNSGIPHADTNMTNADAVFCLESVKYQLLSDNVEEYDAS